MNNNKFIIGITSIGSGVGQSVISSCRLSNLPLRTIGLGMNPFAYGAYDCDAFDYLPTIYDENYVDELIRKCGEYCIDLIIPGLDDEALLLSESIDKFNNEGIKVIVSTSELLKLCRDKEKMSNELNHVAAVFAKSYDKKSIGEAIENGNALFPFIAKPRGGFASRGIAIIHNCEELKRLQDNYIIQELAIPGENDPNREYYLNQIDKGNNPQVSEISIQLVADQQGDLLGRMASYNKLNNGVPIEIVLYENEYVWTEIEKLLPALKKAGLKGPLNLQGRLTDNGLKLFEMNARFTGITGLRALMGFNEVEACIKAWLHIESRNNSFCINYNRFGIRQTADKAIPLERNEKVFNLSLGLNKKELKAQKTLLMTGATGYLGQNFIKEIVKNDRYKIWALCRNKKKSENLFSELEVKCFDMADLESGFLSLGNVDVLLHFGFARPHCSNEQIAESLAFTHGFFIRAFMNQVPAIINISSQSVYGLEREPLWNENTPVSPQTPYAAAKYATELLLMSLRKINNQINTTSLRLATLAGGQNGLVPVDMISKFVRQALKGEPIKISGGSQTFERLDVRDAVTAIKALLTIAPANWKPFYNLGSGKTYNIKEIARIAVETASQNNGGKKSEITIEHKDVNMNFGMDSNLFMNEAHWKPNYDMKEIIVSLIQYFQNKEAISWPIP
jgi:nucleoside-diphosphate-sugar epimerase